jgi:hypothetical protein
MEYGIKIKRAKYGLKCKRGDLKSYNIKNKTL